MDDSHLPIELCERIIDLSGRSTRADGSVVDYPALRACALVCTAWLPRARHNLFRRVALRTAAHVDRFVSHSHSCASSTRPAGGSHPVQIRELELGLPRWQPETTDGQRTWIPLKDQPSIAALLLLHTNGPLELAGLMTLVLSRVQWLYPRQHTAKLMAPFRAVTTLELYYVRFPAPGDLAQVLWALPGLVVLRCVAVYLHFARRPVGEVLPAPLAMGRGRCLAPRQALQVMKLNGCSSTGPFIMHYLSGSAPSLTSLSLRGSFVNWKQDAFAVLSSFPALTSLRLALASPTQYTALPAETSLLASYRHAAKAVLRGVCATNLRRIVVSFEPGLGAPDYLSGARRPLPPEREQERKDKDKDKDKENGGDSGEEPRLWSYGARRTTALGDLLGAALEQVIAEDDGGKVRERFRALRLLGVRVWDTDSTRGRDDAWWLGEASKALPTLCRLRVLRFEVMRDWPDDELLWLDG